MRHLTEDVVVFQPLNQTTLELVRHCKAALVILAHGQGVTNLEQVTVAAHQIPERLVVFGGGGGFDVVPAGGHGAVLHGSGRGLGQPGVDFGLLLKALDLLAQLRHFVHHMIILINKLSSHQAVLVAVLFQKVLGLLPKGVALRAQGNDHRVSHAFLPPYIG